MHISSLLLEEAASVSPVTWDCQEGTSLVNWLPVALGKAARSRLSQVEDGQASSFSEYPVNYQKS